MNKTEQNRALAQQGKLRYVTDAIGGITRKGCGKGFAYYLPDGALLSCEKEKARINALAIPPAYAEVWICPFANGHLQATGRDDAGRKQYRYHPDWEILRDATKFEQVGEFCAALPAIRKQLAVDIRGRDLTRTRLLAAMVLLMHHHYVRIGNDVYAKQHGTYGVTTLRKKHISHEDGGIALEFCGKNGKAWDIDIEDARLERVIKQCEELPGYALFQYEDEEGSRQSLDSQDVNDYLREITGQDFTAKDFRTWAACMECFDRLLDMPALGSDRAKAQTYNKVVKQVAARLGHTVAVCKKSYLHPALHDHWASGRMARWQQAQDEEDREVLFARWWKNIAMR